MTNYMAILCACQAAIPQINLPFHLWIYCHTSTGSTGISELRFSYSHSSCCNITNIFIAKVFLMYISLEITEFVSELTRWNQKDVTFFSSFFFFFCCGTEV
jgi:hypothetical protein